MDTSAAHASSNAGRIQRVAVGRVGADPAAWGEDAVAVEAPLEIRLEYVRDGARHLLPVSVTMRTPGDDVELVLGFLHAEGLLRRFDQVDWVRHTEARRVVTVRLKPEAGVAVERFQRRVATTSSCGACGKPSLDLLEVEPIAPVAPGAPVLPASCVHRLPAALREAQAVFDRTGGLHAAALFDAGGALVALREDVGRHNALDKLVGWALLEGALPLCDRVLLLSGRVSFELVQKAVLAGVPIVAAVGAPSSLAVELARRHGLTLLGFVRENRFNCYAAPERIEELRTPAGEHANLPTVP
jgi:FdhD protein